MPVIYTVFIILPYDSCQADPESLHCRSQDKKHKPRTLWYLKPQLSQKYVQMPWG